jgi:hypothetical protein
MTCPSLEDWLAALDEGVATPAGAHEQCDVCAANQRAAMETLASLRSAVPELPVTDDAFVRRVLVATEPRMPKARLLWLGLPLAAVAVAFVLSMTSGSAPVARGGPAAPSCEVYATASQGLTLLREGQHVGRDTALAFRVRNGTTSDRYIGIFGVDASGRVGWYYPAYESASDEPQLLRIPAGSGTQTLAEQVALPLGPGAVRVTCWMSDAPHDVRDADATIERAVAARAAAGENPADLENVPALAGEQEGIRIWVEP